MNMNIKIATTMIISSLILEFLKKMYKVKNVEVINPNTNEYFSLFIFMWLNVTNSVGVLRRKYDFNITKYTIERISI